MYFSQEQIDRANQADLTDFLRGQGEQLERTGNEFHTFGTDRKICYFHAVFQINTSYTSLLDIA